MTKKERAVRAAQHALELALKVEGEKGFKAAGLIDAAIAELQKTLPGDGR